MQQVLRAQDPDDWRIMYRYQPRRKPNLIKRIIARLDYVIFNTWIGFLLIILFFQTLGCLLAGAS